AVPDRGRRVRMTAPPAPAPIRCAACGARLADREGELLFAIALATWYAHDVGRPPPQPQPIGSGASCDRAARPATGRSAARVGSGRVCPRFLRVMYRGDRRRPGGCAAEGTGGWSGLAVGRVA